MTDFQSDTTDQTAEQKIVYIREVAVVDLPEEVQEQAQGLTSMYDLSFVNESNFIQHIEKSL